MRIFLTVLSSVIVLQFAVITTAHAGEGQKASKYKTSKPQVKGFRAGVGGYSYFELDSQNLNNEYDLLTPRGPDNMDRSDPNPYLSGNLSADSMWWGQ